MEVKGMFIKLGNGSKRQYGSMKGLERKLWNGKLFMIKLLKLLVISKVTQTDLCFFLSIKVIIILLLCLLTLEVKLS